MPADGFFDVEEARHQFRQRRTLVNRLTGTCAEWRDCRKHRAWFQAALRTCCLRGCCGGMIKH